MTTPTEARVLADTGGLVVTDDGRRVLVFDRELAEEGRLGPIRWLSMFLGVAGTYRQNDTVDVVYEAGGRRVVATALPLERVSG